jgi:hypothetical protein
MTDHAMPLIPGTRLGPCEILGGYDVHPSGGRFLFDAVAEGAKPPAITVVLDWTADVKR